MSARILIGDMRERLKELPDNSVDSCVCDPPYHLTAQGSKRTNLSQPADKDLTKINAGQFKRMAKGFMGQTWDGGDVAFQPETWAEVWRVLKPGGHLVAFSGTRTYHRMAVAIEDAGFEVRDMIAWHYGSGFPKSHDVAKAITAQQKHGGSNPKALRMARQGEDYAPTGQADYRKGRAFSDEIKHDRRPTELTDAAREWEGWGTALKPATEPICLARKPLSEKSIAANVLKHGTGALNIDGCRIATADDLNGGSYGNTSRTEDKFFGGKKPGGAGEFVQPLGRWPANLCHDGSDEVVAGFPESEDGVAVQRNGGGQRIGSGRVYSGSDADLVRPDVGYGGKGSAARFFYCAKADSSERGEGNHHPTVKPVSLMCWLVRLVTPKGGTVLDPFMGSGSTGLAAHAEQMSFIGVEMSPEYAAIAERRMRDAAGLFADVRVAA